MENYDWHHEMNCERLDKEEEDLQWDGLICKMASMGSNEDKMARALRRKPNEILDKLGIKRDALIYPREKENIGETSRNERV